MKEIFYSLGIFLTFSLNAFALSYGTYEGGFARGVAGRAESFMEMNDGRYPMSWEDLEIDDDEFDYILPSKRYAFVSNTINLPAPHEGVLLLVTRRPFREQRLYTSWFGAIRHGLRSRVGILSIEQLARRFEPPTFLRTIFRQLFETGKAFYHNPMASRNDPPKRKREKREE